MVQRLIDAYRDHGHLKATLDPLGLASRSSLPPAFPLDPTAFGLSDDSCEIQVQDMLPAFSRSKGSVREVVAHLEHMYCETMSLEAAHVSVSITVVSMACTADTYIALVCNSRVLKKSSG